MFPKSEQYIALPDGEMVGIIKVRIVDQTTQSVKIRDGVLDAAILQGSNLSVDPLFYLADRESRVDIDKVSAASPLVIGTEYVVVTRHAAYRGTDAGTNTEPTRPQ